MYFFIHLFWRLQLSVHVVVGGGGGTMDRLCICMTKKKPVNSLLWTSTSSRRLNYHGTNNHTPSNPLYSNTYMKIKAYIHRDRSTKPKKSWICVVRYSRRFVDRGHQDTGSHTCMKIMA